MRPAWPSREHPLGQGVHGANACTSIQVCHWDGFSSGHRPKCPVHSVKTKNIMFFDCNIQVLPGPRPLIQIVPCRTLRFSTFVYEEVVPHKATDTRLQRIRMGSRTYKPRSRKTDAQSSAMERACTFLKLPSQCCKNVPSPNMHL